LTLLAWPSPSLSLVEEERRDLDFSVVLENDNDLPFSQHYVENAKRLATNLKWCAINADESAHKSLKDEIRTFASLYRRDLYTSYGAMPGLNSLDTAYNAAAQHLMRFGFGVKMSEPLVKTINRNVADAEKSLAKTEVTESISRILEATERPK
jgi:hypothetical protein